MVAYTFNVLEHVQQYNNQIISFSKQAKQGSLNQDEDAWGMIWIQNRAFIKRWFGWKLVCDVNVSPGSQCFCVCIQNVFLTNLKEYFQGRIPCHVGRALNLSSTGAHLSSLGNIMELPQDRHVTPMCSWTCRYTSCTFIDIVYRQKLLLHNVR